MKKDTGDTGTRLKQARQKLGIKQKDLAARLGCTPANICQFEGGHKPLKYSTMVKLAHGLGVGVTDIWPQVQIDDAAALEYSAQVKGLEKAIDPVRASLDAKTLDLVHMLSFRGKCDALIMLARMVDSEKLKETAAESSEEIKVKRWLEIK